MSSIGSDSDSEDDKYMKSALEEAIDGKLLCDSMFNANCTKPSTASTPVPLKKDELVSLPSQRYLSEEGVDASSTWFWQDAIVTNTSQDFLAKKFAKLLNEVYECSDMAQGSIGETEICIEQLERTEHMKLLSDANCYLKDELDDGAHQSATEFRLYSPRKKWEWKRRTRISDERETHEKALKDSVVNGADILSGLETNHWAPKRARKNIFYYQLDQVEGVCKEIPPNNEFTELRLKNNWDECKIRNFKRTKLKHLS